MSTIQVLASRIVDATTQESFAALSGDRNPMHMDHLAARRTQAGMRVVHGVHTLLWALESLAASGYLAAPVSRIRAKFLKWIYLGDNADLLLTCDARANPITVQVEVLGMVALTVDVFFGQPVTLMSIDERLPSPIQPLPLALDFSLVELEDRFGEAYTAAHEQMQVLFPSLSATIGVAAASEIASCSYIVGMEAPGLHSMFSKLDVTLAQPCVIAPRKALHYAVTYLDERFRKGRIGVKGVGLEGTLEVFVRAPPVQQAPIEMIAKSVQPLEFAGMNALVIGGSRGLGELTAKIIAAGGGLSTITYALGRVEAEEVASEIAKWGGKAHVRPYDVRTKSGPQLAGITESFTHIFYFATNTIFKPKAHLVSASELAEFTVFYLQGFYDLCVHLLQTRSTEGPGGIKLCAYYPSTVFIEERPAGMTEYAMTKAAGEQMCRDMNQYLPGMHVLVTRLPRLPTDQTAGVLPERDRSPVDVMIPIVRQMKQAYELGTSELTT